MQNIVWKLLLIVVVVGLCTASLLGKKPRLGKDLRGGVSLVYPVDMPEDEANPQEVLRQVIEVLKDRVNPQGVFDIAMNPLGRDRIEIVMPLPTPEVQALARSYNEKLDELVRAAEIRGPDLDEALASGTAETRFGGDAGSTRGRLVRELVESYEARDAARAALSAAGPANQDDAAWRTARDSAALAEIAFEDKYQDVLKTSLPAARLRRVLNLPTTPQRDRNDDGTPKSEADGTPVYRDSLRTEALAVLRSEYPELGGRLDDLIAASDAYQSQRKGFDDPEDLMRLLRGAGVLEFRIATSSQNPAGVDVDRLREQLRTGGPSAAVSTNARWFPIHQLDQFYDTPDQLVALERDPATFFRVRDLVAEKHDGIVYLLLSTAPASSMTHGGATEWSLTGASPSVDQLGRACVSFTLDQAGAAQMGRLTGGNISRPMAILLDDKVYSAPNIQSQITSSGQITGKFSPNDISYLVKVLGAGSLTAKLGEAPASINILGPTIGADNLNRAKEAFILALAAVAVFMLGYYFLAGFVADVALVLNGIIVFGTIIAIDGTFTLPGLAGIVLTVGMAVDANVLIYERIREELMNNHEDLRTAIRLGYSKAFSTIVDGNLTNLIVCLALFGTGTAEVKGFALTLTLGIVATLFTALFVTRQVYVIYTEKLKGQMFPMLATVIPAIHHALEPKIDWIHLRKLFIPLSSLAVIASIVVVFARGSAMLDTELRGGLSMVMNTATVDANGDGAPDLDDRGQPKRLMLPQSGDGGVEERVREIGRAIGDPAQATDDAERTRRLVLRELRNASIFTVGDTAEDAQGRLTASSFQVKVASPEQLADDLTISDIVVEALVEAFGTDLDVKSPIRFKGVESGDPGTHVHVVDRGMTELGRAIGRSGADQRIAGFVGGVAIVLENLDPPSRTDDVLGRIERMRDQPDFQKLAGRRTQAFGLTPADVEDPGAGWRDMAVVVVDDDTNYLRVGEGIAIDAFERDVIQGEWDLVRRALAQPASLDQVSTYSSAVAETLKANAIVATVLSLLGILVYVWARFGSLRYSLAAIVALFHDVFIALGLLAVSGTLAGTAFGRALGIEPFRIDLGVVAALLTIIGYSLNDTIVILDRIRENRGKLPLASAKVINASINQTLSRTVLTSGTTLISVIIMYAEGGSGIRPFTFCLLAGIVVGTYSSIAIAAPLVYDPKRDKRQPATGETALAPATTDAVASPAP